jgi:hypothetical protein
MRSEYDFSKGIRGKTVPVEEYLTLRSRLVEAEGLLAKATAVIDDMRITDRYNSQVDFDVEELLRGICKMNDQKRQELRNWAARLKGWYLQDEMVRLDTGRNCSGYFDKSGLFVYYDDWRPDSDDAPAWQITSVIEEMRRREWVLKLHQAATSYGAQFCKLSYWAGKGGQTSWFEANTWQEAILLAGIATGEV